MLKVQSASFIAGTIVDGKALLTSVTASTDGANNSTVTVYDNTAASGTVLHSCICPAGELTKTDVFDPPIYAGTGLHFAVSGTGASGNITYSTTNMNEF